MASFGWHHRQKKSAVTAPTGQFRDRVLPQHLTKRLLRFKPHFVDRAAGSKLAASRPSTGLQVKRAFKQFHNVKECDLQFRRGQQESAAHPPGRENPAATHKRDKDLSHILFGHSRRGGKFRNSEAFSRGV